MLKKIFSIENLEIVAEGAFYSGLLGIFVVFLYATEWDILYILGGIVGISITIFTLYCIGLLANKVKHWANSL